MSMRADRSPETGEQAAAVATDMAERAQALLDESRFDAVLVLCGELVERFGWPLSAAVLVEVRRAAAEVGSLPIGPSDAEGAGRLDEASGASADVVISRMVARGILGLGAALRHFDRHELEIEVYDSLVASCTDTADEQVRRRVAWALFRKASALADLGRAGEAIAVLEGLIAKFGSATEATLREPTAWGLWKKVQLLDETGRGAEASEARQQLVDRRDELADPDIADVVGFCMLELAEALRTAERGDEAVGLYDDLIGRFSGSTDDAVRYRVANAFWWKAARSRQLRAIDDEVAICNEMGERYAGPSESVSVRTLWIDCLRRAASTLEDHGRLDEAVAFCDRAVAVFREQPAETSGELLPMTLLSLLRKAVCLCTIDPGSSGAVVSEMADLLPDACVVREGRHDEQGQVSDGEIAALLAELCTDATWVEFATSGDDEASRGAMAERALELYETTRVWLSDPGVDLNTPAAGAATLIRNIAGGFALLSRSWRSAGRESVSLPSQLFLEWAIRNFEIDEWASELGHPVELSDTEELADDLLEDEHDQATQVEVDLATHFLASMREHELLEIACDSPRGQAALQTEVLKNYAASRLNHARKMAGWTLQREEDAVGAAATAVAVTEGLFVATNTSLRSSAELFPNRAFLRTLLNESETYEWLEHEDVELPDWLQAGSSD
jgi:tetratricopeptide (TPR) repeat protein